MPINFSKFTHAPKMSNWCFSLQFWYGWLPLNASLLFQCLHETTSYSLKENAAIFLKRQNLEFLKVAGSTWLVFCFKVNALQVRFKIWCYHWKPRWLVAVNSWYIFNFQQSSLVHQKWLLQMLFIVVVLKYFAIFPRKHLCCSIFLIKLQAFRPATLLKRDSNTGVSCK